MSIDDPSVDAGSGPAVPFPNSLPHSPADEGTGRESTGDYTAGLSPETPLSPSLLARLFAVPLLIVGIIVGCAVAVVLLFGDIVSEPERPITDLVTVLERPVGEKIAGMLLPQDKESWQAARELAMRLTKPDLELVGQDRTPIVDRLTRIIERDAAVLAELGDEASRTMAQQKLGLVMAGLARIGEPAGLPPLVEQLRSKAPATRRDALLALGYYPQHSDLDGHLDALGLMLADESTEVRIVACAVLASVATGESTPAATQFLAVGLDDREREVQWNAALGLARLGDARGKSVLLDLLDREFWEQKVKYRGPAEAGKAESELVHPLPPERIKTYLIEAIQASSRLADDAIRAQIERLATDKDPTVRGEALKVIEDHDRFGVPPGELETSPLLP